MSNLWRLFYVLVVASVAFGIGYFAAVSTIPVNVPVSVSALGCERGNFFLITTGEVHNKTNTFINKAGPCNAQYYSARNLGQLLLENSGTIVLTFD